MRLSLETSTLPSQLPLRQGRAIGWFEDALAPARTQHTNTEIHRLAVAVRSAVGIESLVWLVDVAGLTRDEAAEVMLSSAQALVRAALSENIPEVLTSHACPSAERHVPDGYRGGADLRGAAGKPMPGEVLGGVGRRLAHEAAADVAGHAMA